MTELSTMNTISTTDTEPSYKPFTFSSDGFAIGSTSTHNNINTRRRRRHIPVKSIRKSNKQSFSLPNTHKNTLSTYYTILEAIVWSSFHIVCNHNFSFCEQLKHSENFAHQINALGTLQYIFRPYFARIIQDPFHCIKDKYVHMMETVENGFLQDEVKESYMNIISKAQKHNIALNRFAFICKYKLAKFGCSTDMYLNPISETDSNTIILLHGGRKYSFTIPDLKKIISTSLNNRYNLYAEPLPCKNPYNNLPFTKSDLYTVYFKIKTSRHSIPPIFQQYFECDFILTKLIDKYEQPMREKYIIASLQTTDTDDMVDDILQMIDDMNSTTSYSLNIDDDFPTDVLIDTFRPYLKYYYRSINSLSSSVREKNSLYIRALMDRFISSSPGYGRRISKKISKSLDKSKTEINFIQKAPVFEPPVNYSRLYNEGHENETNILSSYVIDYRRKKELSRRQNNIRYFGNIRIQDPNDVQITWEIDREPTTNTDTTNNSDSDSDSESEETESVS